MEEVEAEELNHGYRLLSCWRLIPDVVVISEEDPQPPLKHWMEAVMGYEVVAWGFSPFSEAKAAIQPRPMQVLVSYHSLSLPKSMMSPSFSPSLWKPSKETHPM